MPYHHFWWGILLLFLCLFNSLLSLIPSLMLGFLSSFLSPLKFLYFLSVDYVCVTSVTSWLLLFLFALPLKWLHFLHCIGTVSYKAISMLFLRLCVGNVFSTAIRNILNFSSCERKSYRRSPSFSCSWVWWKRRYTLVILVDRRVWITVNPVNETNSVYIVHPHFISFRNGRSRTLAFRYVMFVIV